MTITKEALELQKGTQIFIHNSNFEEDKPRIWLSSGTSQEEVRNNFKYRRDAFVPKEPWRQPNSTEYSLLRGSEPIFNPNEWDVGSHIGVVRIPDQILEPLEQFNFSSIQTPEEYQSLTSHPEGENAILEVMNRLSPYLVSSKKLEVLGVQVTKPNLRTVTVNYYDKLDEKLHVGMHLDSWDKAPLRRRHQSRNRLCINLGREDRYFLFINLTLMDMFHKLGLSEPEDISKHYRGTSLGDEFMRQYPSYPVVKLRVGPKEAYIAPTDNLIHDGSTSGKQYPDITLTYIGYFGISTSAIL